MNFIKNPILILITGMILSFSLIQDSSKEEEEQQISKLWKEASECIRTGNWEGYRNCWKHNSAIQAIHPFQGEWLNCWVQIREKYKKLLQPEVQFTLLKNELTLHVSKSKDMAWGEKNVIFYLGENENNTVHLWEVGAFEKVDGEWKIIMGMACSPYDRAKND